MARKWTTLFAVAALALLALVVLAEPTLAQESPPPQGAPTPSDAGDNAGDFIRRTFGPIVLTVAGVMGIAAIIKRDVGLAVTLLILTIVISGFLVDPSPYETWGQDVLRAILVADAGAVELPRGQRYA